MFLGIFRKSAMGRSLGRNNRIFVCRFGVMYYSSGQKSQAQRMIRWRDRAGIKIESRYVMTGLSIIVAVVLYIFELGQGQANTLLFQ